MFEIKWLKTVITVIILISLLFASIWYIFLMEDEIDNNENRVDVNKEVFFSISADKYIFSLEEPINITFKIYTNNSSTIEVSEFWVSGTLYLQLWNSTGHEIIMHPSSVPGNLIKGIKLNSGEIYEENIDIKSYFGMYKNENNNYSNEGRFNFIEGHFTFNATYVNFHPYIGNFNWHNGTSYHSNTIEFQLN